MKRIKQYIGLAAALLLAGTLNSCIKDDVAPAASSDMANVTVKLDSRATDTTDLNVTPEEGIKTLRLIIVQDGTIVINSKHSCSRVSISSDYLPKLHSSMLW